MLVDNAVSLYTDESTDGCERWIYSKNLMQFCLTLAEESTTVSVHLEYIEGAQQQKLLTSELTL